MFKDSDDSDSDIASEDERLEGWKPPTACGVDNSKALSSYDDIASGNVRVSYILRSAPDCCTKYEAYIQGLGCDDSNTDVCRPNFRCRKAQESLEVIQNVKLPC